MKLVAVKLLAILLLSTAAFCVASVVTEAEACGLFGCCRGGYGGACYGPRTGFYGPVGYGYYGPIGWRRWRPAFAASCDPCGCSPCGCDPCGSVACAPCSSGNCGIGAPTGNTIAPPPNEDWQKKTFAPAESGSGNGLGDPGRPGTNGNGGLGDSSKARDLNSQNDNKFEPATKIDESGSSGDAGTGSGSKGSGSSKSRRKEPDAPRIDDGSNSRKAPTINLDEKVAWRSSPVRTRIASRQNAASTRLVRLPAYPKSDWLPVESESKVASK